MTQNHVTDKMEFRKLTEEDAPQMVTLIVDMYKHLDNLEWFSPMPYDEEGVRAILTNPRFFILGAMESGKLCALSSFDFKCGKLIGQSCMPQYCSLDNTAEIGFTMVHSNYKGQGIMKMLLNKLQDFAPLFNKKYLFGKVHIDNIASYKSFTHCGWAEFSRFDKSVKREEFQSFLSSGLLKPSTLEKAKASLNKNNDDIIVKYAILLKELS